MIIIKIKTWKDYKKQFLEWVKESRQEICIQYANYMKEIVEKNIIEDIEAYAKKHSFTEDQYCELEYIIEKALKNGYYETRVLIKETQPKHLL